jgi:hypothetical protein
VLSLERVLGRGDDLGFRIRVFMRDNVYRRQRTRPKTGGIRRYTTTGTGNVEQLLKDDTQLPGGYGRLGGHGPVLGAGARC